MKLARGYAEELCEGCREWVPAIQLYLGAWLCPECYSCERTKKRAILEGLTKGPVVHLSEESLVKLVTPVNEVKVGYDKEDSNK